MHRDVKRRNRFVTDDQFRLDGQRALVTGASSGIGLACAVALAEAGAEVTLAARGAQKLDAVVRELTAEGYNAHPLPLDVSDIATTEAMLAEREPFDVLVNSAGLARHSPALETDPADYDAVMGVNLRAAYFLTRAVGAQTLEDPEKRAWIEDKIKLGRVGEVEDVMGAVVYLASAASALVTGTALLIDGGWTAD